MTTVVNSVDRSKTIKIHMGFSALEGLIYGFFIMSEAVLRRELHASDLMITIFTMIMPVTALFSLYFSQMIAGQPGRINRYIFFTALFTRLPLILFFFMPNAPALVLLTALFYFGMSFIKPVQNIFMKENYKREELGKIFGYSVAVGKVFFIVAVYYFGKMLDKDSTYFKDIFSASGVIAFISLLLLMFIPFNNWKIEQRDLEKRDYFFIKTLKDVFKNNPAFFIFEIGFLVYGAGFMVILAALPILLVDHLDFSYSVISFGRGVVSAAVIVIFTPLFGKFFDSKNPVNLGIIIFLILSLYPITILFSWYFHPMFSEELLYLAFVFFGLGMSGVTIIWNIGPMYFAKSYKEIPKFTSVHVTLTGVRGILVPFIGLALLKIHIILPFIASFIFFASASFVMQYLKRKHPAPV